MWGALIAEVWLCERKVKNWWKLKTFIKKWQNRDHGMIAIGCMGNFGIMYLSTSILFPFTPKVGCEGVAQTKWKKKLPFWVTAKNYLDHSLPANSARWRYLSIISVPISCRGMTIVARLPVFSYKSLGQHCSHPLLYMSFPTLNTGPSSILTSIFLSFYISSWLGSIKTSQTSFYVLF